jgi:hypothetical protein
MPDVLGFLALAFAIAVVLVIAAALAGALFLGQSTSV